ncbi:rhodanese-related sulfurtransferase [Methylobacterium nigriterrae]|uniref:oxygen-dependent tRNA uridine(34) hydroxylase TrhO n=1 Tax=Methylobacterium nigriterrae TaxID=3127512 RepID=UPI003013BE31
MTHTVAALYQFTPLPDADSLVGPLQALCDGLRLTGTLLLAREGINGTVAGEGAAIDAFLAALRTGPLLGGRLDALECKLSRAEAPPFRRMKVKLKPEIVTFDAGATDPTGDVGNRVAPEDWNALLDRPGLRLVDTRNAFEVALGSFAGAEDPGLARFSDFRAYADALDPADQPEIALFCTGGIRCEKAGAYLRGRGFATVHLLQGGILKYLETVPEAESRWRGDCFVFDGRIALGHGLGERPDHPPEALRSPPGAIPSLPEAQLALPEAQLALPGAQLALPGDRLALPGDRR